MTLLYQKRARVLLLEPGRNIIFPCGGPDGYRATFTAKLTAKRRLNDMSLSLYNLSAEDARRFTKGAKLSLEAGYVDLLGEVFKGDVIFGETTRSSADLITEVDVSDGKAAASATASFAFNPGASFQEQITTLIDAAGGDKGFKATIKEKLANAKGRSAYGLIVDELEALVAPAGGEVSYQGDVLQITQAGQPTNEPFIVLSVSSGLLNAEPMDNGRAKITAKIQPGLLPRRGVVLDPAGIDRRAPNAGRYVIDLATLQGDTHGDLWIVTMECTPL